MFSIASTLPLNSKLTVLF